MQKPASKSSLSKIPKSSCGSKPLSAREHRMSSPTVGKRSVGQPKGEVDNVTSMPTITEEAVHELDESAESNKPNWPNERPAKTLGAKLDGKPDRRSADNRSFSNLKVSREEPDNKWPDGSTVTKNDKKASSISSLGRKARGSKLINLSRLKGGESLEQRNRLQATTLSSMNKQNPPNRPKQFSKQPSVKRESGSPSSPIRSAGNGLNLERVKDKIESQEDAGKNCPDNRMASTSESAENEIGTGGSSLLQVQESKSELRNRFKGESIKGNQINQDDPNQISEKGERHEQHICRICLDSIQVDGDDCAPNSVSNVSLTSTDHDEVTGQNSRRSPAYISPCNCKGQSKYVHRRCLSEWIYVSKKTSCQVCLVKFRNIKIKVFKKSAMKWLADEYDHH